MSEIADSTRPGIARPARSWPQISAMEVRLRAAQRIGELVPAVPAEERHKGRYVRDSDVFPEKQRLSEFRKLAEAKMGELLKGIPDKKASSGAGSRSLPDGISKKQSFYSQPGLCVNEAAHHRGGVFLADRSRTITRRTLLFCFAISGENMALIVRL